VGSQRHDPAALSTGKRPGTHCTGGWVGPRAGMDGSGELYIISLDKLKTCQKCKINS